MPRSRSRDWPARVVPPRGAPNILLIMTEDIDFAVLSAFGGVIPTPSLDRIANAGLSHTIAPYRECGNVGRLFRNA